MKYRHSPRSWRLRPGRGISALPGQAASDQSSERYIVVLKDGVGKVDAVVANARASALRPKKSFARSRVTRRGSQMLSSAG